MSPAQRLVLRGPGDLIFEELGLHDPLGKNQLRAKTLLTAISMGTEVAAYRGDPPLRPGLAYPRLLGYCNVGVLTDMDCAVEGLSVGDRIYTNAPHQSTFQGCNAEVLAMVPREVSDEEASFAYIAQLGLAALQRVDFQTGETAAVIGLGSVGLACVAVIKALGGKAVAIGRGARKLAVARTLGAECAIDVAEIDNNSALKSLPPRLEVIVNTASSWSAWRVAMRLARFRTRISVLGFPGRTEGPPEFNPFESENFYDKQLVVAGAGMVGNGEGASTNAPLRENTAKIMQMLRDKTLSLSPLVSHRVSWTEIGSVYEKVILGDKSHIGVVVDWSH